MKVNRQDLKEALLISVLNEFSDIPAEKDIDYSFSPQFRAKIKEISRKSEKAAWRFWHSSKRRFILVTVIAVLLVALAACAVPVIKQLYVDYFLVDNGESFGITFDQEQAANAPSTIEEYWIPNYCPDGHTLISQISTPSTVDCFWMDDSGEYVGYSQTIIPAKAGNSTWIGIDAEDVERSTETINGYKVELIASPQDNHLVAVWTNNLYFFKVEISSANPHKLDVVKVIMDSLTVVDKVEPVG